MSRVTRKLKVVDDETASTFVKVAFASSDHQVVDLHFGAATKIVVFGVNPEASRLLEIIEFSVPDPVTDDDKLTVKIHELLDCIAVYSRACGASAVRHLLNHDIQPVKVSEGAVISELIEALQEELMQGPSSWLAKALEKVNPNDSRFDDMEAEGWEE